MYDKHGTSKFNKVMRYKGCSNVGHMLCHERFECRIRNVPCGDQEKLIRHSLKGESIDKIGILSHEDSVIADGQLPKLRVGGAIAPGQVECMHGLVSKGAELIGQTAREMRINEKFHTVSGCIRFTWLRRVAKARVAKISSGSRSA